MCNIDEFAKFVVIDTCCLLQCIPTISLSLSDSCDVFGVCVFEVHSIYNKINLSLWPCYQANILFLYCMTSFWISCPFFNIYFVCPCFYKDKYTHDVVHLEIYTHERWYLPIWYPFIYCVLGGHAKQYRSLKTMLMLNAHLCVSLIICFLMSPTHHMVDPFLMSYFLVAQPFACCKCYGLCSKLYRVSEDSMFVHFVLKCNIFCAQTLGSSSSLFRTLLILS